MLDHIDTLLCKGCVFDGVAFSKHLFEILEDTDGCAIQYRCANTIHMMHKLAIEMDLVYNRYIDCLGREKDEINGEQGISKTDLGNEFCGNAVYQPVAMDPNKNSILWYQMKGRSRRDMVQFCSEKLMRPEYCHDIEQIKPNKPQKEKKRSPRMLSLKGLTFTVNRSLLNGLVI